MHKPLPPYPRTTSMRRPGRTHYLQWHTWMLVDMWSSGNLHLYSYSPPPPHPLPTSTLHPPDVTRDECSQAVPVFHHLSTSVYYCQCKLMNKSGYDWESSTL